jgi:hypothetical protein
VPVWGKAAGGSIEDVWDDTSKGRINEDELEEAAAYRVPEQKEAQNLSERIKEWGSSYFTFIEKEIPSTNNAAEQAIRAIVIDRKVTQGSRGEWGNRWMERFWSILTTYPTGETGYRFFV